jgi:hypothetical protein
VIRTSGWIELAAGAALVGASIASSSSAQTPAADVMYHALQIVTTLEETGGCDLSLHGTPLLDDTTGRWLVAYSGVGALCDDRGEALQRAGVAAEITFFRRPNADEVVALIGTMRAAVRRGYPCQISFRGSPQFDAAADLWAVRYYASGQDCQGASEALERQGRAFGVAFYRTR